MSAPAKIQTYGALLGASIMGAISQQSLAGVLLGGWGGKLGTAALMGVLSYNVLAKTVERIIGKSADAVEEAVVTTTTSVPKETPNQVPQPR